MASQPDHLDPLELLPINELVAKTHRSRSSVYRDIADGKLYTVLLGSRRMVPRAEAMRYVYGDNGCEPEE